MKNLKNYFIFVTLLLSMVFSAGAGQIKHKFVATDESGNQLIYVDQTNPSNDWTVPLVGNRDVQISKEGTVLVTVPDGYREYDIKGGTLIKEVKAGKKIFSLVRCDNGNTFLASPEGIIELDKNDKQINAYTTKLGRYFRILRLSKKGNFLYTASATTVKELKPAGETVRELEVSKITPECKKPYLLEELDNGRFLVSAGYGGAIHLIDKDWKLIKSYGGKGKVDGIEMHFVADAQQLKNGNIVIANWTGHKRQNSQKAPQAIEFDKDGKVVWKWHDPKRAGSLHGIVVLEEKDIDGKSLLSVQTTLEL